MCVTPSKQRSRAGQRHWLLACLLACCCLTAWADDVARQWFPGRDYDALRAAVVEAIESEGLVVGSSLPFGEMLARTADAVGQPGSPFRHAEVLQFCSARIAWQLIGEAPAQLALCPMSYALIEPARGGGVLLSWRLPQPKSPGRRQARALYQRLLEKIRGELR